jgi:peptidoglycan/LPS O-acetylase OafA/YrhL
MLSRMIRSKSKHAWFDALMRRPLLLSACAGLALWLMMSLYWPRASFWDQAVMVVFWRTFAAFSLGMLVWLACSIRNSAFISATAPLRYLGTISYGIYLWHLPVILSIQRIEGIGHAKALTLVMTLTLLLAAWSWHFFEKQFLGVGKPTTATRS